MTPAIASRGAARPRGRGGAVLAVASWSLAACWPRARDGVDRALPAIGSRRGRCRANVRVPAGQPLTIRASVRGAAAIADALHAALDRRRRTASARTVAMTPDGGGFRVRVRVGRPDVPLPRDRRLRALGGLHRHGARSRRASSGSICATSIRRSPSLPPRDERDGGDIYAPAGTKVRVRVHTDKPIASGEMALGGAAAASGRAAADRRPRRSKADLVLARDDSYRVGSPIATACARRATRSTSSG